MPGVAVADVAAIGAGAEMAVSEDIVVLGVPSLEMANGILWM